MNGEWTRESEEYDRAIDRMKPTQFSRRDFAHFVD
jgi:hypothetical protein